MMTHYDAPALVLQGFKFVEAERGEGGVAISLSYDVIWHICGAYAVDLSVICGDARLTVHYNERILVRHQHILQHISLLSVHYLKSLYPILHFLAISKILYSLNFGSCIISCMIRHGVSNKLDVRTDYV